MNAYDLPTSLSIGGVEYPINCGWRAVMDIFIVMRNPDHDRITRTAHMLRILYPQWARIPDQHIPEAIEKARDFIDCGMKKDDRRRPRCIDWEQDSAIIIPAVNKVAGQEVRLAPDIHWWTFWGWYMSIQGGVFSTVLHIRQKKARGGRFEKWEEEFYRENSLLVDMKLPESTDVRQEIEEIQKMLF